MVSIRIEDYIDQLRGLHTQKIEEHEIEKELSVLDRHSWVFDKLHKDASAIHSSVLEHSDFSALLKFRSLASEMRKKKEINDRLKNIYSNAIILKGETINSRLLPETVSAFIKDEKNGFVPIIDQLNSFKSKLDQLSRHNFKIPLDSRLALAGRHQSNIEHLGLIHKKQKQLFKAIALMLVSNARKQIISVKKRPYKKKN